MAIGIAKGPATHWSGIQDFNFLPDFWFQPCDFMISPVISDFTRDFWFHSWFQISSAISWFHSWFQISSAISWFHSWFLGACWRFLKLSYFSQWFRASNGDFKWLVRFQATVDDPNAVNSHSRRSSAFTSIILGVSSVITVLGCLEFS